MRVAVLGTGTVGRTLAEKLRELGHETAVGSRSPDKGDGTFADVARGAELIVNATAGEGSLAAIASIAPEDRDGKVLLDVSNPLDFSQGFPPRLFVCNDDSLGEQIQREFPELRVVKSLQTVNAQLMVDPVGTVFVAGEDAAAKATVVELLRAFGWEDVVDLGGIDGARGTEMYLALWTRLYGAIGDAQFNLEVVRPRTPR